MAATSDGAGRHVNAGSRAPSRIEKFGLVACALVINAAAFMEWWSIRGELFAGVVTGWTSSLTIVGGIPNAVVPISAAVLVLVAWTRWAKFDLLRQVLVRLLAVYGLVHCGALLLFCVGTAHVGIGLLLVFAAFGVMTWLVYVSPAGARISRHEVIAPTDAH